MNVEQLAEHGTRRQVAARITEAHVSRASDPVLHALLVASRTGKICRGGGAGEASVSVLNAAARRGLLRLTAHPGTRLSNWAFGELTNAGWSAVLAHVSTGGK